MDETFITRFVVKDSIDEKMESLQKEKEQDIAKAIDDIKMLKGLSVTKLMNLFGRVSTKGGKPFILVDDNTDSAWVNLEQGDDAKVKATSRRNTGSKPKPKASKTAKSATGPKGAKGMKAGSGKGSRGGKGAKAANAFRQQEELEAIEMAEEIVIPGFGGEED